MKRFFHFVALVLGSPKQNNLPLLVKMKFFVLLVVCVFQLLVSINAQGMFRASYGENCSKEIRCDSRSFLTCFNGKCDCLMSDTMVFDDTAQKCLTLAGERCQYTTLEGEKTWTDELPCIPHSACLNGICDCASNYFEISNGTCQPKRKYGEECFNDKMCDGSKHLICGGNQTCTCGSRRILSNGECKILAGEYCPQDNTCVDNADCVLPVGSDSTENSLYQCKCAFSHFQTEDGTCEKKRGIGGTCTSNDECVDFILKNSRSISSFLACVNDECKCNAMIASADFTDSNNPYCGKYLGFPCDANEECTSGAECSTVCKCKSSTHFQTANGTCENRRNFGDVCNSDSECKGLYRCDVINHRCVCPSNLAFNPYTENCVLKVDANCKPSMHSNLQECVLGAYCMQTDEYDYDEDYGDYYKHRCSCLGGTIKSFDGHCYVELLSSCTSDTFGLLSSKTCKPGLMCKSGQCVCPFKDHQTYMQEQNRCVSLIGGPCNSTVDCADSNAECSIGNEIKQCKCKIGFTQVDRQCDIAYGGVCEQGKQSPICDRYAPLECSEREICECSDFQVYDNKTLVCRGLVGAKCSTSWKNPGTETSINDQCVRGAICKPFRGFEKIFGLCTCQEGWKNGSGRTCTSNFATESPRLAVKYDQDSLLNEIA